MSVIAVIGSQWGDEGKGKVVDYLSEQADYVARFQRGEQCRPHGDQYVWDIYRSIWCLREFLLRIQWGLLVEVWSLILQYC